jgi:S1-C subfamily serine protease
VRASLGVNIKATQEGETSNGAVVANVTPAFPGAVAGIRAGDVIVSVGGDRVSDVTELHQTLGRHSAGEAVEVGLVRDGKRLVATARLVALPYGPNGQVAVDAKETIKSNRDDISRVLARITKLCNYCGYSLFRMYCS